MSDIEKRAWAIFIERYQLSEEEQSEAGFKVFSNTLSFASLCLNIAFKDLLYEIMKTFKVVK